MTAAVAWPQTVAMVCDADAYSIQVRDPGEPDGLPAYRANFEVSPDGRSLWHVASDGTRTLAEVPS